MYQNIVKAHSVTNDRKVERRKEMVHQVLKSNFFHSLQINNLNSKCYVITIIRLRYITTYV